MTISYKNKTPVVGEGCFIAESADVIGDVTLGEDVSIWFGAVLRGDSESIVIGRGSNVQDNATIHNNAGHPVVIGENVSIGHNAIVHGATVGDNALIGMGAVVMDEAQIGEYSIIGGGAVVKEKSVIPPYSLVVGVPGKIVRTLAPEQAHKNRTNAQLYVERKNEYLKEK